MSEKRGNEHILPTEDGWAVKTAGADQVAKIFQTKKEATEYARHIAAEQKVCMVVHDEAGSFEDFECQTDHTDKHVVKKTPGWAVVAEGGKQIEKIFPTKGAAMAYAYDLATKHNVCMLSYQKDGTFKSKTCPADGYPGILEVFRMKLRL